MRVLLIEDDSATTQSIELMLAPPPRGGVLVFRWIAGSLPGDGAS